MRINIHYRHITHSEELSRNIHAYFDEQLNTGAGHENLHVDLFFSKASPHTKSNGILFECHLRARAPWLAHEIFVKDQGEDFWKLVTGCAHLLAQQIGRDADLKRERKKQNPRGMQKPANTA